MSLCLWIGDALSRDSGPYAQAEILGAIATAVPRFTRVSAAAAILSTIILVFWLFLWLLERSHGAKRRQLHSELESRTEELNQERSELTDAREALRTHSVRDELTGLLNRGSIIEVLDREMARAIRDKSTLSIVLADIDHLKPINETHGQPAGDQVLKEVGRRLEHAIRSYDTAGRYSGGDFLLVLPSFEADTGVERLRKIHDSICGRPIALPSGSVNVTCSFGVSLFPPEQFYSSDELLERASQAMSTAKQDGRNRIGFFARSDR